MYTRSKFKLCVQGFKFEVSVPGTSVVVELRRNQHSIQIADWLRRAKTTSSSSDDRDL